METTFVLISCDLGFEKMVVDELKKIQTVKETQGTFGAYDIITKVQDQDRNKIKDVITKNIRKIQHVRSTLTLITIPEQGKKLS